MLQKLAEFLKENSAKLLIKYDGERNLNRYTIRLLYNDVRRNSLGNDTDLPRVILGEIFARYNLFEEEEILSFFTSGINIGIDFLKNKFGDESVISIILTEKDKEILYTIHVQTIKGSRYLSDKNYKQLYEELALG